MACGSAVRVPDASNEQLATCTGSPTCPIASNPHGAKLERVSCPKRPNSHAPAPESDANPLISPCASNSQLAIPKVPATADPWAANAQGAVPESVKAETASNSHDPTPPRSSETV